MNLIIAWIMSIVGVVVLGVLIDVIIPEGQTNKYIKSVFAIITVFVIVAPIPRFLTGQYSAEELFPTYTNETLDEGFLEYIESARISAMKTEIENEVINYGVTGANVSVVGKMADGKINIEKISIDISKIVIKDHLANINITSGIRELVSKKFGVHEDRVNVYGRK